MQSLNTEVRTFTAYDGGTLQDEQQREKMLNNFMVPRALTLKVGAQVMLIKNLDETLVNGSMGKVIKFADPADPTALDDVGAPAGTRSRPATGTKPLSTSKGGKDAKFASSGQLMPVVDFLIPGGGMRRHLVSADVFKVELPNGEVQVSRTQVRAQGLSLECEG